MSTTPAARPGRRHKPVEQLFRAMSVSVTDKQRSIFQSLGSSEWLRKQLDRELAKQAKREGGAA